MFRNVALNLGSYLNVRFSKYPVLWEDILQVKMNIVFSQKCFQRPGFYL